MKFFLLLFTLLFSLSAYSADVDPWGYSGYNLGAYERNGFNYSGHKLTNKEAEHYRALGVIRADGTINPDDARGLYKAPPTVTTSTAPPKGPPALPPQPPAVVANPAPVQHPDVDHSTDIIKPPKGPPAFHPAPSPAPVKNAGSSPTIKPVATSFKVNLADKAGQPLAIKPKTVAIPSLLNAKAAPKQTTRSKPATAKKYVHVKAHPVKAHPTLPANATQADYEAWHQEVAQVQKHIAHIEQSISKAIDLSLSANAMAQLPQATEGRSSISFGMAAADGRNAEAIGYSSNFGEQHEYTVKISISHSGSENAVGTGLGYQW